MKIVKTLGCIFVLILLLSTSFNVGRNYGQEEVNRSHITIKRVTEYDRMSPKELHIHILTKIDSILIMLEKFKSKERL